jgi:hypothetical protein
MDIRLLNSESWFDYQYVTCHRPEDNKVGDDTGWTAWMSDLNKRKANRLDCGYKCLLQHDDILYPCEMINISNSGALVDASFIIPINIQLGDTCNLLFSNIHTMSSQDHKSRVTHLEGSKITLQFLAPVF